MGRVALDPHPLGCPLMLAHTPAQMREVVTRICQKLRDVAQPTVHVVNPSKGQSYPILNLHGPDGGAPRLVVFPAWEDNAQSAKRRVTWGRATTLIQRIHDSGVRGETLESFGAFDASTIAEPYAMCIAATADAMDAAVFDLQSALGDVARITVASVPQPNAPDLQIVRIYATKELMPRLVFAPAWRGTEERPDQRVDLKLLGALVESEVPEIAASSWLARRL